jgi:hypothetical protein
MNKCEYFLGVYRSVRSCLPVNMKLCFPDIKILNIIEIYAYIYSHTNHNTLNISEIGHLGFPIFFFDYTFNETGSGYIYALFRSVIFKPYSEKILE